MAEPRIHPVDEYGVVDPLRLPPGLGAKAREAWHRVRPMSPVFWAFAALAIATVSLATRALSPWSATGLSAVVGICAAILAAGAVVLMPTAVLFARREAAPGDRLLLGSVLVATVPAVALVVGALVPRSGPDTFGVAPLGIAADSARAIVPAVGWAMLALAIRPGRLAAGTGRASTVAVVGVVGAVLTVALDVVVASSLSDVSAGAFDESAYLASSIIAAAASLGLVAFATMAAVRSASDRTRGARLAAVGASLLVVRLSPGPAVALLTLALGTSDSYDATPAYALGSVLALAGYALLLLAFGSGYGRTDDLAPSVAAA